jgi:hypothetical protein
MAGLMELLEIDQGILLQIVGTWRCEPANERMSELRNNPEFVEDTSNIIFLRLFEVLDREWELYTCPDADGGGNECDIPWRPISLHLQVWPGTDR